MLLATAQPLVDIWTRRFPMINSSIQTDINSFTRTETPSCDSDHPETCQVGDLSGKHGNISQITSSSAGDSAAVGTFQAMYLDAYLSTDPNNVAFFGNRSIVVHAANGTRLNCGNFTQHAPSNTFGNSSSTSSSTATATNKNAAASVNVGQPLVMAVGVFLLGVGSMV
jgi:hypothetical protein